MADITRDSLLSLEAYARQRPDFRAKVMAHKTVRTVGLGDHLTLFFEDELTIRYQIQEMLRIERTFEEPGIQDELDVYNPLLPDGRNFKATMMVEFPNPDERRIWLAKLIGVEDCVWIQVQGYPRVFGIADEDLERENDVKTSAVHFLRCELTAEMAAKFKSGAAMALGVDHPEYRASADPLPELALRSLREDLV